jgi:glycogen(starch) synthase
VNGVTLVGRLPPPTGGMATHLVDIRAMLERRGVPVVVVEPRRELRFLAGLCAHAPLDVVHVHAHGHSEAAWWQVAALQAAPRCVLTIHSGQSPRFIVKNRAFVRTATLRYRAIICVSEVIRDAMLAAGASPEQLWTAPAFLAEALDDRMMPAGVAEVRRRHAPLLSCAVAPPPEYGTTFIVEAFERVRAAHPDAALVLTGPGVRKPSLLRPGVYLFGQLARAESLGLIASCDVFVRPTLSDGDSISVREALALGRRVVATDAARRPAGVRLCRPADPAALAQAIEEALAAPPPRVPVDQAQATLLAIYRRLGVRIHRRFPGEAPCAASRAA